MNVDVAALRAREWEVPTSERFDRLREATAEERVVADEHLAHYVVPKDGDCIACGAYLNGSFAWGLQHGCGYCASCDYPYRLYHFVQAGGAEIRLVVLLAASPCEVGPGEEASQ